MLPVHPRIVHVPVALAALMPLVSAGLLLAWWRGWLPRRAWAVAVLLQLALVVGGGAAILTGKRDSRIVETVVDEALVDEHEDAAELLVVAAGAVLVVAAGAQLVRSEGAARTVAAVAVAGTLGVLGLAVRAGDLGGRLVYVHGAVHAWSARGGAPGTAAPRGEHEEHR